ncbi:MAG: bifunctional nicotinamidase/pyrazinamidase [Pseudomonadota bacterium]
MTTENTALIIVDVQNDFCPGGALAVAGGDEIVDEINALQADCATVVATQDWHPAGHGSFASSHGAEPFSTTTLSYGEQVLWPDHCVIGTEGAAFHGKLNLDRVGAIIRKGSNPAIDSYSAFFENDKRTTTGLHGYLQERAVSSLLMVGLATDFCVAYSALDAARLGYAVTVRTSACRAIDMNGETLSSATAQLREAGVSVI